MCRRSRAGQPPEGPSHDRAAVPAAGRQRGSAVHRAADVRAAAARRAAPRRRRRRGDRRAVRHRHQLPDRGPVRPGGDLAITPGNAVRTAEQIHAGLVPVLEAGIVPLILGGDHSIVLGELRAQAAVHGPVGLVLLDAHADTWDQYYGERYFHGTPFRRAVEEGLLDPSRSLLAGVRGALYDAADGTQPVAMGVEGIPGEELQGITPAEYGRRARQRIGDGPVYMSFDIDVLDPAFAPGTGTPEVTGLFPRE